MGRHLLSNIKNALVGHGSVNAKKNVGSASIYTQHRLQKRWNEGVASMERYGPG